MEERLHASKNESEDSQLTTKLIQSSQHNEEMQGYDPPTCLVCSK